MARLVVKIAIALFVVLLIGSIALLLSLPLLISSDFARTAVSAYSSGKLQRPVSIEKLSFSWGKGFSISHLAIADKDQSPLLKLADLRLVISWRALVAGKIDVVALDINGIDATLSRDREGKMNISDMLETPEKQAAEKAGRQSRAEKMPALFLNGRIREGTFTFIDERLKTTTRIKGLSADLSVPSLDKPLSVLVKGDVILNNNPPEPVELTGSAQLAPAGVFDPYRGKGSLEMKAGFGALKVFFDLAQLDGAEDVKGAELSCSLDLYRLTQLAAGIVGLPPGFSLKGTLSSSLETRGSLKSQVTLDGTTELKKLSVTGGPMQKGSFNQSSIVFSHNINYHLPTSTIDINSCSLKGDFVDLALSGTVSDVLEKPHGTIRLSGSGSLDEIVPLTRKLLSLPPDVDLAGTVNLSLAAEGDLKRLGIQGTTSFRDLNLSAAFLAHQPFREKSLKIVHNLGLSLGREGKGIDAIEVSDLSIKGDFIDLSLSGAMNNVLKNPTGKLLLSGSGRLGDVAELTRGMLSLPADLRLSGDAHVSLSAEGEPKGLTLKGTAEVKDLFLSAAFLNNQPFRQQSLRITPDVLLTLSDKTGIEVHSLSLQSEVADAAVKGTFDSDATCNLTGTISARLSPLKKNLAGILPSSFPDDGQLVSDLTIEGNLNKSLLVKGSHRIDGLQMAVDLSEGEGAALSPATFSLPRLALMHDAQYAGDQDTLTVSVLQVDSPLGTMRWSGLLSRIAKDLFMNGKGELSLNMEETAAVIKGLLPEDLKARGKATLALSSAGSLSPPAGVPFLASWSGNGSLSVESIDYLGMGSIRNLRTTKLALDKGLLDASLECALNDGGARLETQCDFNREKPDVQMTADVRDIRVSQDLRLLGYLVPILIIPKDGQISGKGAFSVQASWQGMDWQSEIGKTIKGRGTLSLRDGTIRSQNVLSVILKAFGKPDLFPYEQIMTNFRLAEEKVFNDDILVNGKEFDLNIKGWTSLVYVPSLRGNPLEYSVKGNLIQKAVGGDAGKVLSIIGGGETVLPVAIAGTVQDPKVAVRMPKADDIFRGLFRPTPKQQ